MKPLLALLLLIAVPAAAVDRPPAVNMHDTAAFTPLDDFLLTLPLDKGLPVIVRTGVYYQSINAFDENGSSFTGTVDSRMRWEDPRLRYPAEETPRGFKEYRGDAAEEELKRIWSPGVSFTNFKENPTYQVSNVRIFPDGWVEVMQRTTAQFSVSLEAENFPFDRQLLTVELEVRKQTASEAALVVLQEDIEFSRAAPGISIDGWSTGLVSIDRPQRPGWYGEFHSTVVAGLEVKRQTGKLMAAIFIPLIASLLIPLVTLWMNDVEDGQYKIDAFELANVIVGGIFAVIALNFTVNSSYSMSAIGDNTVSRLFGLNYGALAIALLVAIFMYRFNILRRLFGRFVEEETFYFLQWAVPLTAFGMAAAFIMVAAVG